jgi:two-component system, NtrC family, sensor kinase
MATKKTARTKKAKPPRPKVKTSVSERAQTIAELRQQLAESVQRENATAKELQHYKGQFTETLEQQTATSEILGVIASSPTDIQPVLDIVAKTAAHLCDARDAAIWRTDGQEYWLVASHGPIPVPNPELRRPMIRSFPSGRAMIDRETVHIHDVMTPESRGEFSDSFRTGEIRTILTTPLLREGIAIGAIHVRRPEVRPFTDKQITLLKTFADQAVIAIENVRLFQELKESLEQQTATSEILGVIASSPTNIQPVLDTVAKNAARVCGASNSGVFMLVDGTRQRKVAGYGTVPGSAIGFEAPLDRGGVTGRAIVDRQTIHIHDFEAVATDYPSAWASRFGFRTMLATPLLREGVAIGAIGIHRMEVRPFTERQICLLKTFSDQAVIAIENVRLFKEIQERNAELHEALEHQTATSEVLGIISRSPTDVQPVLDAIVESAAKVCGIDDVVLRLQDGNAMISRAHFGPLTINRFEISIDEPQFSWIREHGTLHIPDASDQTDLRMVITGGWRTFLIVPLCQKGALIGGLFARRTEVRPFTPAQIKLLETFADQAVIALENVRLFQELKESLEQQTATSEILGAIASSPTEIQPVLDTVAEHAARLCDASDALIHRIDGNMVERVAVYGTMPVPETQRRYLSRGSPAGRAIIDRQTIHVHDVAADLAEFPDYQTRQPITGVRTTVCTPLLREGVSIGVITVRRKEVRPFTEKQIELLKTFADQAVIAIENVRLFKELERKNRDLTEALDQQTATGEVLRVIASSPTELQPVLDTVIANAVRLIGAEHGHIRQYDGEFLQTVAYYNISAEGAAAFQARPLRPSRGTGPGRAFLERKPIHTPDVELDPTFELPPVRFHTFLSVPMLREGIPIGTISIWREMVAPFTERQIDLVTTFADQAVIAIENVRLFNELKESLEQQTATSEILGVIASSPTDLQPVLDVVAETSARLCDAIDSLILRVEGDSLRLAAQYGSVQAFDFPPFSRGFPAGRAVLDCQTIHVHDLAEDIETEYPEARDPQRRSGTRTVLVTPLLREGMAIGVIVIRRLEVRPFTNKQIALFKTFADQAVIAIENVRLFKELQGRNAELREALEHQTATSEVLGIISRSPTDVQPVLDAIVESAARVCGIDNLGLRLREGNNLVSRAQFGPVPAGRAEVSVDEPASRWIREHGTLHIPDLSEQNDFQIRNNSGSRTFLFLPLRHKGEVVGTLTARRFEARPFTPAQIKLLETFADQAVIAIENVRLFQELKESLEQQTATSEILGVIASSPTDIQPVLNVIAENAARICGTPDVAIMRVENNGYKIVATFGSAPVQAAGETRPLDRGSVVGRSMIDCQTIHIRDVREVQEDFWRVKNGAVQEGLRTMLAIPLLRKDIAIGAIVMRRTEVFPFTEKQIALLKTFADQAVIAIENVRLFKELQERNGQLREALEHQTATSEVLSIISRSPTDVQPVFDAIVESAAKVCGVDDVVLRLRDGNSMVPRAHYGPIRIGRIEIGIDEPEFRWIREHGTLHIPDIREHKDFPMVATSSWRTFLSAPLRQQEELVGVLTARRTEVSPFTTAQIKLLETFASQAVIALENVRLFQELKESLEQQTATSEILGVIASSPTDIQPVLDTVAKNAARLCEAADAQIRLVEGDRTRSVASFGSLPAPEFTPIGPRNPSGRAILTRQTLHIHDLQERKDEFPESQGLRRGLRTFLSEPMLREGTPIGVINIRRTEVRPFSDKHIKLLKTFASQAVIAIENVRLFQELKESLEQQTATSEILGVIASSPTDIQPVLNTVAANAARLCEAIDAQIRLIEGDQTRLVASFGNVPAPEFRPTIPGTVSGRAILKRETVHVHDLQQASKNEFPDSVGSSLGVRTILCTPMLREGTPIGVITVRRTDVRPFSDKQIKLLETFASQAVIAIENVRLFQELQQRTHDLVRSVGELKALGEVGQAVSSTLDLETVLTRIASHAVQLTGTAAGAIYEYDEESAEFHLRGSHQIEKEFVEALRESPIRLGIGPLGRAASSSKPVEVTDILDEREFRAIRLRAVKGSWLSFVGSYPPSSSG